MSWWRRVRKWAGVRPPGAQGADLPGLAACLKAQKKTETAGKLPDRDLRGAELKSARLDPKQLASGDKVWQVGFNSNGDYVALETLVSRIAPVNIGTPDWASFQAVNVDVVHTRDNDASSGGVLCDRRGRVHALWATFFRDTSEDGRLSENWGIPIRVVQALLEQIRAGEEPRSLAAQFSSVSLTAARDRGLSQTRVDAIERKEPVRRRVLTVDRTVAGTQAATLLIPGDLVLAGAHQGQLDLVLDVLDVDRAAGGHTAGKNR